MQRISPLEITKNALGMGMHNIEKWSLHYALLRFVSRLWHHHVYYRKVTVLNLDQIPVDQHLIFAPVHQNALMDALAALYDLKSQPVFLARSDIFQKPILAKILYAIKILPIFRIRDGISQLKQNDAIFAKTIDVIKNKNGLAILPEGHHEGKRRLKPLKKGIARIAFQAEEATDFSLDIRIVPVGLDYSNYRNFRSSLLVIFGKPVELSAFYDLYRENPARGMNKLLEELSIRMKEVMIHIGSQEFYDLFDQLRELYKFNMAAHLAQSPCRHMDKFLADQKLVNILEQLARDNPEKIREIVTPVKELRRGVRAMNFRYWVLHKKLHSFSALIAKSLLLVVLSPLFIWGVIHNYLPYKIPVWLVRPIRDIMFHSSVKFVTSFLIFQVYYLILFILIILFVHPWWLVTAYLISIPVTGLLSFHYYILAKKTVASWRYNVMMLNGNSKVLRLHNLYLEVVDTLDSLVKPHLSPE